MNASMGPRLVSRGNVKVTKELHQKLLASMGPRLVSRGNTISLTQTASRCLSFNGAATR